MVQLHFFFFFAVVHLHIALIPRDQVRVLCVDQLSVLFHHASAVRVTVYFQPVLEPDVLAPAFRVFIHADDREVLHVLRRQVIFKYLCDNVVVLIYTVVNPSFIRCCIRAHEQVTAVWITLIVTLGSVVVPSVLLMVENKSCDITCIAFVARRTVIFLNRPVCPHGPVFTYIRPLNKVAQPVGLIVVG